MNRDSIIQHVYTGLLIIEGENINPNGDPDDEGAPRQDSETGFGRISPQSLSRRVKDRIFAEHGDEPGYALQIARGVSIEAGTLKVAEELGIKPSKKLDWETKKALTQAVAKAYVDSRLFGNVLNVGSCPTEGLNGVITVMWGKSVHPIRVHRDGLTRVNAANDEQQKKQEMGRSYKVPHGVYRQAFTVNPHHAEQNGATMGDLAKAINGFINAYEYRRSVMSGMISVRGLWLFRHESKFGNAPAYMLLDRVQCSSEKEELAEGWGDYNLRFDAGDLPAGITVFTLEDLLGGHEAVLAKLTE